MAVSVDCKLLLYADDSALLVSDRNPQCVAEKLSKELETCRQWLVDNKLSLHLGKTECILFGSKRKLNQVDSFSVTCNDNQISPTNSAKYLGVTLDESLSGEAIACNILKKAGARLAFLYRHAHFLNEKSRKTLSTALILCHYDYACSSWYTSLSKYYKNKLQTMQNRVVRFILNWGPRTHIGQQELDKVGLLSVKDRVIQMKMNHVFKIFQGTAPDYLNLNFTRTSSIHKYSTRGSPFNFIVPKIKGQASQTFYFTAIRHWNFLPNSIKETGNFPKFKHAVKKHLSDQARIAELNPMYHDRY
jgi:hypothetical protein